MDHLKTLLRLTLIIQLIFVPTISTAQKKSAPNPAQRKIHEDKLIGAALQMVARRSAMVTTEKDFEKLMLQGLKAEDRKIIMTNLKGAKKFPSFQVKGNSLWIDAGVKKLELKVLGFGTHQYEFEGVKWTYDPSQKFAPQFEKLARQLSNKKKTASWHSLLFPEAEAFGPLIGALLGWLAPAAPYALMVVSAGVGAFSDEIVAATACMWSNYTGQPIKACEAARKLKDDALYANAPALDAVAKKSGSGIAALLQMYKTEDRVCPDLPKGVLEYRGRLQEVSTKEGETVPVSNWFNINAKFDESGAPTDFIITKSGGSGSADDPANLIAHIAFDPTRSKPVSYRIPNPTYDPATDLLGNSHLVLSPAMRLTPEQTTAIEIANNLIAVINSRIYSCVAKQVEENQAAGIETDPSATAPLTTDPAATQ